MTQPMIAVYILHSSVVRKAPILYFGSTVACRFKTQCIMVNGVITNAYRDRSCFIP